MHGQVKVEGPSAAVAGRKSRRIGSRGEDSRCWERKLAAFFWHSSEVARMKASCIMAVHKQVELSEKQRRVKTQAAMKDSVAYCKTMV